MKTPSTKVELRLVKAAAAIHEEVLGPDLHFSHSLLCQLGLPYRDLKEQRSFERSSGRSSLRLEAGAVMTPNGWKEVGLPWGAKSRLLMIHLCSQSLKTQSPVVNASNSFTHFCEEIGLKSPSGRAMRVLKDQIDRMSAVSMRLSFQRTNGTDIFQGSVFEGVRMDSSHSINQRLLWDNQFRFNPTFFESLLEHSVPIDLRALKALSHSSRAIDIYCFLTARLYRIPRTKPVKIRWTSLRFQFGNPNQEMESFKRAFITALKQVLLVYPQAANSIEKVSGGLKLKYAPPSVSLKTFNSLRTIPDKAF